jgi:N-acetylmuramoyl-L-alanine amidase
MNPLCFVVVFFFFFFVLFYPTAACPHIVPRSVWGARDSHCSRMTLPAKYAIILHTAGRTCSQPDECRLLVRDLQSFFMNRLNACDIGYK